MGAAWSPERRAAYEAKKAGTAVAERPQSEYESEIMRPDGQPANGGADTMSRTEMFMARMRAGKPVTTEDDVAELGSEERQFVDEGASVRHTSAGLVWMYKKEIWGWRRLRVSRNSLGEVINAGLLDRCGACGSTSCVGEINMCPRTPKVMYRDCPVNGCNGGNGHRVYDDGIGGKEALPDEDPFAIRDTTYESTPQTRTKAMLDEHIRWYHPQTAAYMGINNIQPQAVV